MKKIIYFAAVLFAFASCSKEDIENTATVDMAGEWYVTIDGVDEDGNLPDDDYADFFGDGRIHLNTFNTSANLPTEMWVSDMGNGGNINFMGKVKIDLNTLTFATDGAVENIYDEDGGTMTIEGGKILLGAGRQNNGSPADSIVFYLSLEGDPYPAYYGFSKYKVSGVRYSGLAEND